MSTFFILYFSDSLTAFFLFLLQIETISDFLFERKFGIWPLSADGRRTQRKGPGLMLYRQHSVVQFQHVPSGKAGTSA